MNLFIFGKHANKGATIAFLGLGVIAGTYSATAATAAPEDEDEGVSERLDIDGNSCICPTLGFRHAGDGLRAAELSDEVRAQADRFLVPFAARRADDDRARAQIHWVEIACYRAGEVGGIADEFAELSDPEWPLHEATETTARLDIDGNSQIPASLYLRHSADSLRAADIDQRDDATQDRHRAAFPVNRSALRHWVEIECVQAGEAGGIRDEEVDLVVATGGRQRIAGEAT